MPPPKAPPVGAAIVRPLAYAAVVFGLWHYTAPLCFAYVDAEQERVESSLLRQSLEHKQAMRAAEQGEDAAEKP